MGLPMFREPEEIAAEQTAAKLDQIAAARRSSIRREPSIRPNRQSSGDGSRLSPRTSTDRTRRLRAMRIILGEELDPAPANIEDSPSALEAQIETFRRNRLDRPLDRARDRSSQPADVSRDRIAISRFDPDFLEVMGHFQSHADPPMADLGPEFDGPAPDISDTISQNLPRPSRESGLRFEVGASSNPESDNSHLRRFRNQRSTTRRDSPVRPTRRSRSPYSFGLQRSQFYGYDQDASPDPAALTPGFAPAQGPIRPSSQSNDDQPHQDVDMVWTSTSLDTPFPERESSSYPPLRRVNHLSPHPISSGPRVDGLGDRLRSPSPISDSHEEENWRNLLTTIPVGRASNATSFLSSRTDSQSASNTDSQRASQATTTTSFGEIGGDDTCDLDLPFGITEEQVREIRANHGRGPRHPASRSTELGLLEMIRHRLPSDRDLGRRSDHSRDSMSPGIDEIRAFSDILQRMQRREEVPDIMWAAVGFSPDVVRQSAT